MKNIVLCIVFVLLGFGLMFLFLQRKMKTVVAPKAIIQEEKPSLSPTFSIEPPPSDSIKGIITSQSGHLLWSSRIATAPSELKNNTQIQQGEQLITQEKSTAIVSFPNVGTMTFSEKSDISFIQTLPIDLVVQQNHGTITYIVSGQIPLSIRMRSALLTTITGTIKISMTDGESVVLISTTDGTAQIGYNDKENISRVFTLRTGQVYEYNSDERTTINTKNK